MRIHFIATKKIFLKGIQKYLCKHKFRKIIMIYDQEGYEQCGDDLKNLMCENPGRIIELQVSSAYEKMVLNANKRFKEMRLGNYLIACIGGCSALDFGRALSAYLSAPYITIPTILSTNCIAINQAVIKQENGISRTMKVKKPLGDFICPEIMIPRNITMVPKYAQHTVGSFGEMIAMLVASLDWQLAANMGRDTIDQNILNQTIQLFKKSVIFSNRLTSKDWVFDHKFLLAYAKILAECGELVEIYGNDRPISGSEHKMYHALRAGKRKINATHGEIVGICGRFIMMLYKKIDHLLPNEIVKLIRSREVQMLDALLQKMGFPCSRQELTARGINRMALQDAMVLSKRIKPERYTLLDFLAGQKHRRLDFKKVLKTTMDEFFRSKD